MNNLIKQDMNRPLQERVIEETCKVEIKYPENMPGKSRKMKQ
jgi:hypothetical protein